LILFEHALAYELPSSNSATNAIESTKTETDLENALVDQIVEKSNNNSGDEQFKSKIFELYAGPSPSTDFKTRVKQV
jgi:hypothetical protein